MFDFGWSEIALIGVVALLFIGPKDMPVAIRTITNLLKKGRKLAGEFQSHVDEMVRDADLGEARDQFRQLRSLNVRGQVMKALDSDGSLKRTFDQKPFASTASSAAPAEANLAPPMSSEPVMAGPADPATSTLSTYDFESRPTHGISAGDHGWVKAGLAPSPVVSDATPPAPQIIPPQVASRLRAELAQARPPSFLPPRPVHANAVRPARDGHGHPSAPGPA